LLIKDTQIFEVTTLNSMLFKMQLYACWRLPVTLRLTWQCCFF